VFDQPALARQATPVAAEGPVALDDTMARDDECENVRAVRPSDRPACVRIADGLRQRGI
jgi:hypothetical protein